MALALFGMAHGRPLLLAEHRLRSAGQTSGAADILLPVAFGSNMKGEQTSLQTLESQALLSTACSYTSSPGDLNVESKCWAAS